MQDHVDRVGTLLRRMRMPISKVIRSRVRELLDVCLHFSCGGALCRDLPVPRVRLDRLRRAAPRFNADRFLDPDSTALFRGPLFQIGDSASRRLKTSVSK